VINLSQGKIKKKEAVSKGQPLFVLNGIKKEEAEAFLF
jgi:hypothetical protein